MDQDALIAQLRPNGRCHLPRLWPTVSAGIG